MFDPQASIKELMESDKLDDLLAQARSKVAAFSEPATVVAQSAVNDAVAAGEAAAQELRKHAAAIANVRASKVAIVRHMAKIASRLVA